MKRAVLSGVLFSVFAATASADNYVSTKLGMASLVLDSFELNRAIEEHQDKTSATYDLAALKIVSKKSDNGSTVLYRLNIEIAPKSAKNGSAKNCVLVADAMTLADSGKILGLRFARDPKGNFVCASAD